MCVCTWEREEREKERNKEVWICFEWFYWLNSVIQSSVTTFTYFITINFRTNSNHFISHQLRVPFRFVRRSFWCERCDNSNPRSQLLRCLRIASIWWWAVLLLEWEIWIFPLVSSPSQQWSLLAPFHSTVSPSNRPILRHTPICRWPMMADAWYPHRLASAKCTRQVAANSSLCARCWSDSVDWSISGSPTRNVSILANAPNSRKNPVKICRSACTRNIIAAIVDSSTIRCYCTQTQSSVLATHQLRDTPVLVWRREIQCYAVWLCHECCQCAVRTTAFYRRAIPNESHSFRTEFADTEYSDAPRIWTISMCSMWLTFLACLDCLRCESNSTPSTVYNVRGRPSISTNLPTSICSNDRTRTMWSLRRWENASIESRERSTFDCNRRWWSRECVARAFDSDRLVSNESIWFADQNDGKWRRHVLWCCGSMLCRRSICNWTHVWPSYSIHRFRPHSPNRWALTNVPVCATHNHRW